MLARGVTIAYAESMDAVGANAAEVHPTVLTGVPRFYEKAYARILASVATRPPLARRLFQWGLARGTARARARFARTRLGPVAALAAALADLLVFRAVRARLGGKLRYCVSGGAPLAPRTLEFFFAIGIPILEGYGLTETSPVICLNVPGKEKPGAVGPPIPGVEVRLVDTGEILTRGPHVMQGYFRNPDATREAIEDGWFHTGDIGRFDSDGCLVITDRLKDLLVTAGGKKIAPQPIEAKLKDSGWIGEAVLLGDRRPYVVALLVPHFAKLEAEAGARGWPAHDRSVLLAHSDVRAIYAAEIERVNATLAPFEQIKTFELIDHDLTQESGELTPSLKVKRRVIVEHFAPMIEAMYGAGNTRVGSAA
jgi:long-chain acyl-CoA synthetase